MASRISHDIRNPLSNIRMSLELIKEKSPDTRISDPLVDEKFKIAFDNVERISHQVNNVLDYVRTRKMDRKSMSLYSCLDDTVQSLSIPDNIQIKYDKTDLNVIADPIQLQIVCNNILTNAIQAIGKDGGEIKVRFAEDKENVKIEIENTGPSISKDVMPKIFESLITTKEIGTGLGLASCKRIIESHGGKITAKNNPTTFSIFLPKS
ncbi:MAG: HAMP domain-containing sensor histidine kinase [Nitrosopumilaceae archaeon]